ncbi:MAG: PTS sugar transporter subunit IIA [Longimonas sp.]|uniref:PTS sugar transporter subunit IIA n=1 Tax=Longimonas sp. TaxID=2039626 RepID=UPI0039767892
MSVPAINDLLHPDRIRIGLSTPTKSEAIDAMVDLLDGHPSITTLPDVRDAVFKRESTMSTGVGHGLGLPHAKTSAASDTVAAFATVHPPVDFDAIDSKPVDLLLLLVGPEADASLHIKVLGRISRLVHQRPIRKALSEANDPDTVVRTFQDAEAALHQ